MGLKCCFSKVDQVLLKGAGCPLITSFCLAFYFVTILLWWQLNKVYNPHLLTKQGNFMIVCDSKIAIS